MVDNDDNEDGGGRKRVREALLGVAVTRRAREEPFVMACVAQVTYRSNS